MSLKHENPNFKSFITELLVKSELSKKFTDILTSDECMTEFTKAFTHSSINELHNYEYYEILGDVTTNKVVVWYFHERFNDLFKNPGVGNMGVVAVMARLKMNGISKKTYSKFANDLGFWEYIRATDDAKKSRNNLLEDTFESFIGCLEYLISKKIMNHAGEGIVTIFMKKLMDKLDIKLDREKLYDHKSLLNEDINSFRKALTMKYVTVDTSYGDKSFFDNEKNNISKRFESHVMLTDQRDGNNYKSKSGYGITKAIAEQAAAELTRNSGIFDLLRNKVIH
jgi:dsRNA-specific ribonuclease